MATLDDLFREFLSTIEPSEAAVTRAKTAHEDLRKDLEKDETYGPYVARTLLSGSYGRHTAIQHIKDVDVIIQTTFTKEILREKKREDESEQRCLLRLTQEAIRRTGRVASTRQRRRSIYVKLPEEINDLGEPSPELTMDIVPVLIQTDKDEDPMTIADKELVGWYDTYPITQLADSRERNKRSSVIGTRHSYKPVVKMFKAWKQAHFRSTKTPKGFVLECLAARYHDPEASTWIEAIHGLFQSICDKWPDPDRLTDVPEVPDISNLSSVSIPIAKEPEDARKVLRKVHQHLLLVEQAMEESKSDLAKSAKTLQRVFGEDCDIVCFPLPEDDSVSSEDSHDNMGSVKSSPFVVGSRSNVREAPPFGNV
ncbi:MAG TPA: hypothetical protein PKO09_01660 [Anaerolineae bacterium]|nr:hypothetical protein [Anaerolineae bacterium]